jgi:hypothetical protein
MLPGGRAAVGRLLGLLLALGGGCSSGPPSVTVSVTIIDCGSQRSLNVGEPVLDEAADPLHPGDVVDELLRLGPAQGPLNSAHEGEVDLGTVGDRRRAPFHVNLL